MNNIITRKRKREEYFQKIVKLVVEILDQREKNAGPWINRERCKMEWGIWHQSHEKLAWIIKRIQFRSYNEIGKHVTDRPEDTAVSR